MTILEVLIAMVLLSIGALGMVSGMLLASNGNAISRRRTEMLQFAQARLERLATRTRTNIPTSATTTPIDCSAMNAGGTFDPNAAPGTGGWMLDVIDLNTDATGAVGDDLMVGPLLLEGQFSGVDSAATIATRTSFATSWFGGADTKGCGSSVVTSNAAVLCREIHVEPADVTVSGTKMYLLRAWVRVVQGGTTNWKTSYVTVQQDIAQ
jgi:type II secretory pathway pseudopilin PulG